MFATFFRNCSAKKFPILKIAQLYIYVVEFVRDVRSRLTRRIEYGKWKRLWSKFFWQLKEISERRTLKNNVTKGKRPTDGIRQTVKGRRGIKNKVWLRRRKTEMQGAFGKTCRLRSIVNKHGETRWSAQSVSRIHGRAVSTVYLVRGAASSYKTP